MADIYMVHGSPTRPSRLQTCVKVGNRGIYRNLPGRHSLGFHGNYKELCVKEAIDSFSKTGNSPSGHCCPHPAITGRKYKAHSPAFNFKYIWYL